MNDALRSSVLDVAGLTIAREFYDLIYDEALLGTGIENAIFWTNFSSIIHDLTPKNRALLVRRDELQAKLDAWYREHGAPVDIAGHETFLRKIGYLLPEGPEFSVATANVDPAIATVAGPQLVVR